VRTAARRNDGTVNDRRRPRVPAKPKPSPQLTGPVQLDDETRNALILFNARLVAQEESEREKRRVEKAAKAKDDAAAKVRELENNPKATAEQKAEAQAAYLASLDALNRAKAGEPIARDTSASDDDGETAETDDDQSDTAEAAPEATADESVAEAPEATADESVEADTEAPEAAADEAEPAAVEAEPAEAATEVVEAADEPAEAATEAEPEPSAEEPEAGDES
jgi:hypothetical protein